MNGVYEFPTRISYYDLDSRGVFKPSALLKLAHIAADVNAGEYGFGYKDLFKHSMTFVLQRFGAAVKRMPVYGEDVVVATWPAAVEKGTFIRHGLMRSGNGDTLIEWTSLWVLFDLSARRILKPGALPAAFTGLGALGVTACADKVDMSGHFGDMFSSHTHIVRYNETDTNMHMNNIHYGDLILNAVYGDTGSESDGEAARAGASADGCHHLSGWGLIQINYLAETLIGQSIDIACQRKNGAFRVTGSVGQRAVFNALLSVGG